MRQIFNLPIPTGVNATYKTGNGNFYKSEAAREWEKEALYQLMEQHVNTKPIVGLPVYIGLEFFFKRDRDIDSCVKILLDLLQGRLYENDKQIEHLNVKKYKVKESPMVTVTITEIL